MVLFRGQETGQLDRQMRAFPYLRVSGKTQVDGDGPERQLEKIQKFAQQHGLSLGPKFFDAGISGTVDALERPEFAKLLTLAEAGDAIVVERVDRLARELMVQEFLLLRCAEKGVKVFATDWDLVDLADSNADPARKLMRQIFGAISEFVRGELVLKMKRGADKKRRETGRCGGVAPYGELEGEKKILDLMLSFYRDTGYSLQMVADLMNECGNKTRSGKQWTKARVHNAISRHIS